MWTNLDTIILLAVAPTIIGVVYWATRRGPPEGF